MAHFLPTGDMKTYACKIQLCQAVELDLALIQDSKLDLPGWFVEIIPQFSSKYSTSCRNVASGYCEQGGNNESAYLFALYVTKKKIKLYFTLTNPNKFFVTVILQQFLETVHEKYITGSNKGDDLRPHLC